MTLFGPVRKRRATELDGTATGCYLFVDSGISHRSWERFPRRPKKERLYMDEGHFRKQSIDPTQELTITIPCRLAERVKDYAEQTNNTIEGVVIEAQDGFLRGQKTTR